MTALPVAQPERFTRFAMICHWLTLVLVLGALGTIEVSDFYEKGTPLRTALHGWHFQWGLAILAVTLVRLVWRFFHRPPEGPAQPGTWETWAALGMHWALYGVLLLLPLLGILGVLLSGTTLSFLGWPLPLALEVNKTLGHDLKEVHETLGNLFIGLISLHVAAALWHQWLRKDHLLSRMLPW